MIYLKIIKKKIVQERFGLATEEISYLEIPIYSRNLKYAVPRKHILAKIYSLKIVPRDVFLRYGSQFAVLSHTQYNYLSVITVKL